MEDNKSLELINFTDSAEKEIRKLHEDIRLAEIIDRLSNDTSMDDELRTKLLTLVAEFASMFSYTVPYVDENNLVEAIVTSSREINLSKLLRERGLFRLYKVANATNEQGLPLYAELTNPITGGFFARQEDMIGWFCSEAHVSRSLVFMRFSAISKCIDLGYNIDEAFKLITSKPYAISETFNLVAKWEKGKIKELKPEVAQAIVDKMMPEKSEEMKKIIDSGAELDDIIPVFKPALSKLIEEVAEHDRVKEVLDFVKHDILEKPEIAYRWDTDLDCLVGQLIKKAINLETGVEFEENIIEVVFVTPEDTPEEIKQDLIRRLPIANKNELLVL